MKKPVVRKVLLFTLMLLFMVLVSGCWSRKEIDQSTFISALAIDQADDDPQLLEVTVEFIIPKALVLGGQSGGGGGGAGDKYWLVSVKGVSVSDAFSKIEPLVPYHFFLGHLTTIIIGEKVAREGIKEILDTFDRMFILRRGIWITISPDRAKNILHTRSGLKDAPSLAIEDLFSLQNITSVSYPSSLNRVLIALSSRSTNPVIARVSSELNKEEVQMGQGQDSDKLNKGDIKLEGTAIFKHDKFVDWLDGLETRGVLWVQDKVRSGMMTISNPKGNHKPVTFEIRTAKTKLHTGMLDGKLFVDINIYLRLILNEQTGNADILSRGLEYESENIQGFNAGIADKVKQEILSAVSKAQQYQTDIFGIGERFYVEHPQKFKKLQDNWPDIFAKAEFNVEVEPHIRRIGLDSRSISAQDQGK